MRIAQIDTAIDSFYAHRDSGRASRQAQNILDFISARHGDWSIGEIANAMGLQKSTVSARVYELIEDGKLVERPKRKDRISHITVRPVSVAALQLELCL